MSFIEKRLILGKKLLAKHGVIFLSIDDNEYAQLKMLCDQVFSENNFITSIIWQSKTGSSDAITIDTVTEYILVYAKSKNNARFLKNIGAHKTKRFKHQDKHFAVRGPYYSDNLDRGGLRYSDSLNFPILCPDGQTTYPNGRNEFKNDGWTWKWSKKKVEWGIHNDFISFQKSSKKQSGWAVYYKNYLFVDNEDNRIERSLPFKNIISDIKTGDGAKKIKEIFGYHAFKYAKPVELIVVLLRMIKLPPNATILDFMAGTGTTGEAILEFNSHNSTSHKFILCTNNENNICTDICYPRIKKNILGYKFKGAQRITLYENKLNVTDLKNIDAVFEDIDELESKNNPNYDKFEKKIEDGSLKLYGIRYIDDRKSGLGGNLRYFKTAFVDADTTHAGKKKIANECIEMLCLKEACFDKYKSQRYYSVFTDGMKYFCVIYDYDGIKPFIKFMQKFQKSMTVYQFTLDDDPTSDDYEEILKFVTLKPIPAPILRIYRELNLYG